MRASEVCRFILIGIGASLVLALAPLSALFFPDRLTGGHVDQVALLYGYAGGWVLLAIFAIDSFSERGQHRG